MPPPTSFLFLCGFLCFVIEVSGDVVAHRGRQRKGAVFPSTTSRERKPNIVLILTDDQDVELGSLNFMPKTLRAVRDQGAQFRHAYVTTPMCCPSRSSLLTGMYVHNHHVYTNNDNCSSTQWQTMYETKSFATYLSNAGYRTGYFGKYLNKYNGSYVPPGWREWGGLIMNSKYYNYSINMNGKKIKHGFDYHKDYYPDLIANDSIAFLRQSKKNSAHKPVMLTMSFPAPHGPEDSAPQYSHLFFNVSTHHTPSYDYAPNPDKQWILQVTKKMLPIHKEFTNLLMTKRLQTLQSVDSAVQMVVEELEKLGELHNTYIIYTSDHGYHLGQFGLIKGKSFPFEFDVRVPFLVRGPGVEPGTVVDDIVLNIDLAPTFLDIAGVDVPEHMDGRSVLPLFLNAKRRRTRWPDTFLIESSGRRELPFDVKQKRFSTSTKRPTEIPPSTLAPEGYSPYSVFSTFGITTTTLSPHPVSKVYESGEEFVVENGDLDDDEDGDIDLDDSDDIDVEDNVEEALDSDDSYNNEANITSKTLTKDMDLKLEPRSLQANKLERLSTECTSDEMRIPCRVNQKWYCVIDNGRWRKHKCKPPNPNLARNFRKCACFTSSGLIYKKIPIVKNITRRHTRLDRIKREAAVTKTFFDDLEKPRIKRSTLDHVETVMKHVQGQLIGLKSVNDSFQDDPESNTISEAAVGCIVGEKGFINCSTNIYNDRKTWRQSRHQIDNEIYQLKQKLEKLKEIRKHLKHTRPLIDDENRVKNKTSSDFENATIASEGTILELPTRNSTKQKRRRKLLHRIESTTLNPFFNHNHHRHNHKSTARYFDVLTEPSTSKRPRVIPVSTTTARPEEDNLDSEYCHCEPETFEKPSERDRIKETKRKIKDERLRKKLRKQRRKDQLEKECASEKMNCFHHDNEHWKTAPLWTEGPFCFCMNANNNTYSCVRTINSTHNFLYCEFTTGLVTYYNLRIDPYELQNRIDQLKKEERLVLHEQLKHLIACKGKDCTVNYGSHHQNSKMKNNMLPMHSVVSQQHRYKKRKLVDESGHGGGVMHGSTLGVKVNMRNKNSTAMMSILRQAGIKRRRRKTSTIISTQYQ